MPEIYSSTAELAMRYLGLGCLTWLIPRQSSLLFYHKVCMEGFLIYSDPRNWPLKMNPLVTVEVEPLDALEGVFVVLKVYRVSSR